MVGLAFVTAIMFDAGLVLAAPAGAAAAPTASKERSRLEELFIWKTSEELKLAPATEQKYSETIYALNARRHDANAKMDTALSALGQAKTKAQAEKALTAHRTALKEVQAVQTAEIEKLRPLLGPEKLAQYIVVKNSILEKLKAMLAAPAPTASPASVAQPSATVVPTPNPASK